MASAQAPGSSAPSSNINSPIIPPSNGPLLNGALPDLNSRSSPAPGSNASVQGDARAKRNKRDSRKKREAKGLDPESAPPPKKRAAAAASHAIPSSNLSILRPLLLAEPRSSDRYPPQPRQLSYVTKKASNVLGKSWDFYEVVDKLTNKNGFRYSYAIADPGFPHIKYRQTDVRPYHARFSFEDSPAAISFSQDATAVTTSDAWHTARANVCAREGTYYYEARVISGVVNDPQAASRPGGPASSSRGHVRLGFARREADLDVNVGVDCYGYGIRDVNGEVVNRMRCEFFFPKGEAINEGDVIGMLITLPPLSIHKKIVEGTYNPAVDGDGTDPSTRTATAANIVRDRIPFHYKSDFCWQQSNVFSTKHLRDYAFNLKETPTFGPPSPLNSEDASLRTLPGSSITIFKNGVKIGSPFKELYAFLPSASRLANGTNNLGIGERENADDGMIGYYPAVSCYGGGAVECRFEGPWWIGPPETTETGEPIRPIGERFNDQIVEDVVADIVDEVEAMFTWGGVDGDVIGNNDTPDGTASGAVGGSEVLQGGVGAALDSAILAPTPGSAPGTATASHSAANSNQATPAAMVDPPAIPDAPVNLVENGTSVAPVGTPSISVEAPALKPDEDVEMT